MADLGRCDQIDLSAGTSPCFIFSMLISVFVCAFASPLASLSRRAAGDRVVEDAPEEIEHGREQPLVIRGQPSNRI